MAVKKDNLFYTLKLYRSKGIGPVRFYKLINRFGDAYNALQHLPTIIKRTSSEKRVKIATDTQINKEIELTFNHGAEFIIYSDQDYPPLLRQLHNSPPVLIIKGHKVLCRKKSLAIVGSRNASYYSIEKAKYYAEELGKNKKLIISGLATGIDAAAHQGALPYGTIGVIGCGIDVVYPKSNSNLYQAIAEQGAIISQYPIGTKPITSNFPARNAIIAAMTRGTLVVEAYKKSGSLITANIANDLGREVFALPGSGDSFSGNNDLIRNGANLVDSVQDILDIIDNDNTLLLDYSQYGENSLRYQNTMPYVTDKTYANDLVVQQELTENLLPEIENDNLQETIINFLHTQNMKTCSIDNLIQFAEIKDIKVALIELDFAEQVIFLPDNQISLRNINN